MSLYLRRIHMYAALFLVPWVLMYALSTAVMNHAEHLGGQPAKPAYRVILDREYHGTIASDAPPEMIAMQLLEDLGMAGRHRVRKDNDTGQIIVNRDTVTELNRISFDPRTSRIRVENAKLPPRALLAQLHRRRGFESTSFKDDAWGLSVDAFVVALLFWILSGVWLWWQLRTTRKLGVVSLAAGIAVFCFFLLTI